MLEIILLLGFFLGLSFPGATHQADVGRVLLAREEQRSVSVLLFLVYLQGWEIKLAQGSRAEIQSMASSLQTRAVGGF